MGVESRVEVKPTSLAYWASVLPLHHIGSLMSPHTPVYVALCLRGQSRLLHLSPWNCKSPNAYNYIDTGNGFTYTSIGQVQQPYSVQLVKDLGHSASLVGVTKMGNIVLRVGIEHICLAFRACVLPLHHVGSLMSLLYPCPPVYVALWFRGQCTLLHLEISVGCVGHVTALL